MNSARFSNGSFHNNIAAPQIKIAQHPHLLCNGGVFDDDFIDSYIVTMTEVECFEMTPHPVEFDMYYSQ